MHKSILQIAPLSWIYILLSPPRETELVINFAQGSLVPWSENKSWSIIVLFLPSPSTITACLFVSPGVGRACRLPELNGTRGVEMCESASAVKVLTDIGVTQWWWGCWCSTSRFPGHTAGKQKQGRAVCSTTSRLFWLQCTLRIALKAPVPKHNSHQDAKLGQSVRGKIAQSSRFVSCQMSSEAMVYTLYI